MRSQKTVPQSAVYCAVLLFAPVALAQNIEPFYASDYTLTNLGMISGLPTHYGAIIFKDGDPQTILIGADANHDGAAIYEVAVARDANGHITGFTGTVTKIANAPGTPTNGIDGGLAYGPDNVLFYTTYSDNHCGQIKPGSMGPDKLIDLTALGVLSSTGALGFVPPGFAGEGRIKFTSYDGHEWYDASVSPDGTGTFNINGLTDQVTLPNNGPNGFAYVKAGHPSFTADSIIQVEHDADLIATYEIDSTGDPKPASRRILADTGSNSGPISCTFDPISGDLLISNFSGSTVFRVRGFLAPTCFTDADADGVVDCDDACPNDANKTDLGVCGCGMTDTDANANGTVDCLEQPALPQTGCCAAGVISLPGMFAPVFLLVSLRLLRRWGRPISRAIRTSAENPYWPGCSR